MTRPRPTSADYINSFTFDHIETYSLLRGEAYETEQKAAFKEYERLTARKKRNELTPAETKTHEEWGKSWANNLIDSEGNFHSSSQHTHTFKNGSPEINRLINILKTPAIDVFYWMCPPIYRDAVIFYNESHQIVSVLNICLSCNNLGNPALELIDADDKAYDLLKQFFIELGHQIESAPTAT